ncbi:MAG: hypothetical protein WAW37_00410 [Syntrophobacteraceae bacterium]
MYKDKFIAFVDILGFTDLVRQSEEAKEGAPTLEYLLDLTRKLGSSKDSDIYAKFGPTICPDASYLSKDLDFRITQISDCVVVSAEVSPAGAINLLHHCFGISIELLMVGRLCRGFVTRGNIFHTDKQFVGSGYMNAYKAEAKVSVFQVNSADVGTPFIEIDPAVCTYLQSENDQCVKTMFKRMTETDANSNTCISPFSVLKRMPTAFVGTFNQKEWNNEVKSMKTRWLSVMEQLRKVEVDGSDRVRMIIGYYIRKIIAILETLPRY